MKDSTATIGQVFKENPPPDIWPTPDKLIELSPEKLDHYFFK
jgi:hypothetical protein